METLWRNVQRGAEMLDRCKPNWFLAVDTDKLDQRSEFNCVVGQNYGDYYKGKSSLGWPDGPGNGFSCTNDEDYEEATRLWKEEILTRRQKPNVRLGKPATNEVVVTKAQLEKAKAHIASVAEQVDAFVPDLTPAGCLLHVLMSLGINVKVEN